MHYFFYCVFLSIPTPLEHLYYPFLLSFHTNTQRSPVSMCSDCHKPALPQWQCYFSQFPCLLSITNDPLVIHLHARKKPHWEPQEHWKGTRELWCPDLPWDRYIKKNTRKQTKLKKKPNQQTKKQTPKIKSSSTKSGINKVPWPSSSPLGAKFCFISQKGSSRQNPKDYKGPCCSHVLQCHMIIYSLCILR